MNQPLDKTHETVRIQTLPCFQGREFVEGAKHTKLYLDGKQSLLPRHSKELGEGLRKAILRQLNIKN